VKGTQLRQVADLLNVTIVPGSKTDKMRADIAHFGIGSALNSGVIGARAAVHDDAGRRAAVDAERGMRLARYRARRIEGIRARLAELSLGADSPAPRRPTAAAPRPKAPRPAPIKPTRRAPVETRCGGVRGASRLRAATSVEEGAAYVDNLKLTGPQLKRLAKDLDVSLRSGMTNGQAKSAIVDRYVGFRLDHDAVGRMAAKAGADAAQALGNLTPAQRPDGDAAKRAGLAISDIPLTPNRWGTGTGPIEFHPSGAIGTALDRMGDQRSLEVDGEPLANTLGRMATETMRGQRTPQQLVDDTKRLRDRLPDGPARRALDAAIEDMDAPARAVPRLPEATPVPLRTLMHDLIQIPLARKDRPGVPGTSEISRLADVLDRWAAGQVSPMRLIGEVEQAVLNGRHESLEGKAAIDRSARNALTALEEMRRKDRTSLLPPNRAATRPTAPLTHQAALDAVPARLVRAPEGHYGNYDGEDVVGPPGMGSVRALSEYEGPEYEATNSYLRHGPSEVDKHEPGSIWRDVAETGNAENAARVVEIDKTMAASRLTAPVQVERVIRHGKAVFGEQAWYGGVVDFDDWDHGTDRWEAGERPDLTGVKWRDAGYVSTTADPKVAEEFGSRWRQLNSRVEGEPVIMRIAVPTDVGGVQLAEMGHAAEILLERGLTFEVTADHGVDSDGYRRIDVRVVPDGQVG
jgi:hypothetical protein